MDRLDPSQKPFPVTRNVIFGRASQALYILLIKARDEGPSGPNRPRHPPGAAPHLDLFFFRILIQLQDLTRSLQHPLSNVLKMENGAKTN